MYFFSERVTNRLNKLDSTTICATTVNGFKNQLLKM